MQQGKNIRWWDVEAGVWLGWIVAIPIALLTITYGGYLLYFDKTWEGGPSAAIAVLLIGALAIAIALYRHEESLERRRY